jgi:glycosidase
MGLSGRRFEMGSSNGLSQGSETPRKVSDIQLKLHKDPPTASPSDWRDHPIYFLLVDRFNDAKPRPLYEERVTLSAAPGSRSSGDDWQGGTLQGITDNLEYIKGLGCTAIWLSPIFKNRKERNTYHGYGIQNFLEVDHRFGTLEDLQKLVKEAHGKEMYVILDIVINHTGNNWAYDLPQEGKGPIPFNGSGKHNFGFWRYWEHPDSRFPEGTKIGLDDAVWPEEFRNREWYARRGEICHRGNPEEARSGDFGGGLKKLNTSNHDVLTALIEVYKYWIAVADIDGYRLDAIKHVGDSSTAMFCSSIREYALKIGKKNFFLFGEITADDQFINKFIGRSARIPDTYERFPALDSVLDYPLCGVLEGVIKGDKLPFELSKRYEVFTHTYSDHGQAGQFFVTFVDNHDQPKRFLHPDKHRKFDDKQVVLAVGYLLTSMGVPCIYYGTEQGFDGGGNGDAAVRENMFGGNYGAFGTIGHHFFNPDHPIYRAISEIARIRRDVPALRYGRQYFRQISGDGKHFGYPADPGCTLAYSRILDDTEILIAMNLDSKPKENDWVNVDSNLMPKDSMLENLLAPQSPPPKVELAPNRWHAVKVPLDPFGMAILKLAR